MENLLFCFDFIFPNFCCSFWVISGHCIIFEKLCLWNIWGSWVMIHAGAGAVEDGIPGVHQWRWTRRYFLMKFCITWKWDFHILQPKKWSNFKQYKVAWSETLWVISNKTIFSFISCILLSASLNVFCINVKYFLVHLLLPIQSKLKVQTCAILVSVMICSSRYFSTYF